MQPDVTRDLLKIKDILQAIYFIKSFTENENLESFFKSDLIQSAVIRQFEIIGEAGTKVSVETQSNFPSVPWRSIKAFRNLLIHEYFKVDAAEVWTSIQIDLPALEEQIEEILIFLEKE